MPAMNPIDPMWLALAAAVVLIALGLWGWRRSRASPRPAATADRRPLDTLVAWQPQATRVMTSSERQAYRVLSRAYPGHVILAQVPLARFLRVPTRHSYSEWLRRIGAQCADLVICDADTQVLAVVAVRGREPPTERALKRHSRMARVLSAAQIPLHLWLAEALPTPEGARKQIGLPLLPGEPVRPDELEPTRSPQREAGARGAASAVPVPDEVVEMRDPPNSTWFDDLDSGRVPLDSGRVPLDPAPTSPPGEAPKP
jgi:hypothetical protein